MIRKIELGQISVFLKIQIKNLKKGKLFIIEMIKRIQKMILIYKYLIMVKKLNLKIRF
jgi:hypothetical protein